MQSTCDVSQGGQLLSKIGKAAAQECAAQRLHVIRYKCFTQKSPQGGRLGWGLKPYTGGSLRLGRLTRQRSLPSPLARPQEGLFLLKIRLQPAGPQRKKLQIMK